MYELQALHLAEVFFCEVGLNNDMTNFADSRISLAGVVLAGGRSLRLGQDKLRLKIYGLDAPDLLAQSVALLSRYCGQVLVACRQGQEFPEYSCVYDEHEGLGPIAGLQAAMLATRLPLLVISCDLPFMDDATIQRLIAARASRPENTIMTTFRQAETGFIEALTSIYEPDCLALFTQAIGVGQRQINLIIPPSQRHDIVYAKPSARPFFNINYPEDMKQAHIWANSPS